MFPFGIHCGGARGGGGRGCCGAGGSWVFVRLVRGWGGVVPAGGAIIMQLIRLNFEC